MTFLFIIILQSAQQHSAINGRSPLIPLELIIITAIMINPFSINVHVNYSHLAFSPLVLLSPASTLIWFTKWALSSQIILLNSDLALAQDEAAFCHFLPPRVKRKLQCTGHKGWHLLCLYSQHPELP